MFDAGIELREREHCEHELPATRTTIDVARRPGRASVLRPAATSDAARSPHTREG